MVFDKLENYGIYTGLSERIKKAFDYVNNTDLVNTPNGKYEIEGDDIFANVMEYDTKDESEAKFEGHQVYIDLQYIISGSELVGLTFFDNQKPTEVYEEKDLEFYNIKADNMLKFDEGTFMLFFPEDLHMPGVNVNKTGKIKKVVVKIRK